MAAPCLALCTTSRGKAGETFNKRPTTELGRAEAKIMELQVEVVQLKAELANAKRKKDMYRFTRAIRKTLSVATITVWSIMKDTALGTGQCSAALVVLAGAATGAVCALPLENAGKIVHPGDKEIVRPADKTVPREDKETEESLAKAMAAAQQEVEAARMEAAAAKQATDKHVKQRVAFMQAVASRRSGTLLLKACFAHWRRDWDLAAREEAARAWEEEALETVAYFREEAEKQMTLVRAESEERVAEAKAMAQAAREAEAAAKSKTIEGVAAEVVEAPLATSEAAQDSPVSTRSVSWAKPEAEHEAEDEGMASLPPPPLECEVPSPPPRKRRSKAKVTAVDAAEDAAEKAEKARAAAASKEEKFMQKLAQRLDEDGLSTDEGSPSAPTDEPHLSSWFRRPSSPGRVSMRRSPRKVKTSSWTSSWTSEA